MSNTKNDRPWTEGPWKVDSGETLKVKDAKGNTIAVITQTHPGGRRSPQETMANARLFAAAGEMYEALDYLICVAEDAMRWANRDGAEYDISEILEEPLAVLRAALESEADDA